MGNIPIQPLVDTLKTSLTKVAAVSKSSGKFAAGSLKTNSKLSSATSLATHDQQATVVQGTLSAAYGILSVLLTIVMLMCIPAVRQTVTIVGTRARGGMKKMTDVFKSTPFQSPFVKFVMGFARSIFLTLLLIFNDIILPIITNIFYIIGYLLIAAFFVYVGERHPDSIIRLASDVVDLGVKFINMMGYILQGLGEFKDWSAPVDNMLTRYSFFVMLQVYDSVSAVVNGATVFHNIANGRHLESVMGTEGFTGIFQEIFVFISYLYDAQMEITIAICSIFIQIVGILVVPFFSLVSQYILAVIVKFSCGVQGTYCIVSEVFDYFVYNLVAPILGGLIPITHDIACSTQTLTAMGVGARCAGELLSIEPPGPFRNADVSKRRSTLSCTRIDDNWHEQIDGVTSHTALNESTACPMVKMSLTPLGNALNMKTLLTQDCYDICVGDVKFSQCTNDRRVLLGPCGTRTANWTLTQARRRLNGIFVAQDEKAPIWLGVDSATRRRLGISSITLERDIVPFEESNTRDQNVASLRDLIGSVAFKSQFGECDLSKSPTNIFEIIYDGGCVAQRLFQRNGGHIERRSLQDETQYDWIDKLQHDRRILDEKLKQSANLDLTPLLGDVSNSSVHALISNLKKLSRPCPQGLQRCPPSIKCVPECPQIARRRLSEDLICPEGQLVCPNNIECVDTYDDCYVEATYDTIGYARLVLTQTSSQFQTDAGSGLAEDIECWRFIREHPEFDPGSPQNIERPIEELLLVARWCRPLWKPNFWVYEPIKYSLKEDVYAKCAELSPDFQRCTCPMFYVLPSTTLRFGQLISSDIVYIWANGLIWFKNIIAFIFLDLPGKIWSSIFVDYMFGREFANAPSLYRTNGTVYMICYITHLGSAMITAGSFYMAWYLWIVCDKWFQLIIKGGRTALEREVEEREVDMARLKAEIEGIKKWLWGHQQ